MCATVVMSDTGCPNFFSLQLVHKSLAAQSLGLLLEVEGQCFERRLATFLPLLHQCLSLQAQQEERHRGKSATGRDGHAGPTSSGVHNNGDLLESHGRSREEREGGKVEEEEEEEEERVGGKEEEEEEEEEEERVGGKEEEEEEEGEAALDSLLFSTLVTLEKICNQWLVLCSHQHSREMKRIWGMLRPTRACGVG